MKKNFQEKILSIPLTTNIMKFKVFFLPSNLFLYSNRQYPFKNIFKMTIIIKLIVVKIGQNNILRLVA